MGLGLSPSPGAGRHRPGQASVTRGDARPQGLARLGRFALALARAPRGTRRGTRRGRALQGPEPQNRMYPEAKHTQRLCGESPRCRALQHQRLALIWKGGAVTAIADAVAALDVMSVLHLHVCAAGFQCRSVYGYGLRPRVQANREPHRASRDALGASAQHTPG